MMATKPSTRVEKQSIQEQAAYWYVLLESSDCTSKQRELFKQWKNQSEAHRQAFAKVESSNNFVEHRLVDPIFTQMTQEALEQSKTSLRNSRWLKFSAVAAIITLAVGFSFFGGYWPTNNGMPSTDFVQSQSELNKNAQTRIYKSAIGQRSTIDLADGSAVTLNTNSRIEVVFSAQQRAIKLTQGQAYFDVAKDIHRPFVVEAGDKRVVALGTAFEVKLDQAKAVQVTLVEGKVAVDDVASENIKEAIQRVREQSSESKAVQLLPGDRLIAKPQQSAQIIRLDNANESTSWRDGRLVYRREAILNVIQEMNRYTNQKITLADDNKVKQVQVSGVFRTGNPALFLKALTRMHPLEMQRTGLNEVILVWRE